MLVSFLVLNEPTLDIKTAKRMVKHEYTLPGDSSKFQRIGSTFSYFFFSFFCIFDQELFWDLEVAPFGSLAAENVASWLAFNPGD